MTLRERERTGATAADGERHPPLNGGWLANLWTQLARRNAPRGAAPQAAPLDWRTQAAVTEAPPAPPPAVVPEPAAAPAPTRARTVGGLLEERVEYKQTDTGPLHLQVVRPGHAPAGPGRPCVVFFHGGGWRRGSPDQFMPFCRLLAQRGVVGACAEFRQMGEGELIPVDAVADARSALRWVRANAAALGCDPQRIGAAGGSSGGHLALMTALRSPVDDPLDDRGIDPKPALLILFNTPLNFEGYASEVPVAERRRYSPYHLLDDGLPPTLAMHGTRDKVVAFRQLEEFAALGRTLGVKRLDVVPFEGRGHGFFNRGSGEPGDFTRSALAIASFLGEYGWL